MYEDREWATFLTPALEGQPQSSAAGWEFGSRSNSWKPSGLSSGSHPDDRPPLARRVVRVGQDLLFLPGQLLAAGTFEEYLVHPLLEFFSVHRR